MIGELPDDLWNVDQFDEGVVDRTVLTEAANRYLEQGDRLVLDVANPVGEPSLKGIENSTYACVNPGNIDRSQGIYEMRKGDGLSQDDINSVVEEFQPEDATYMVVCGVSQLFDYYVTDFGHVDCLSEYEDRDAQRKAVAEVYADNLSGMNVDNVVMSENAIIDPEFYGMGCVTSEQLEYFEDQLQQNGWETDLDVIGEHSTMSDMMLRAKR